MEPERVVDADDLERLAKLLTDKRQLAEQYYARACRLVGQAQATPLAAMLRWAGETATELGNRAAIVRAAEKGGDPFGALSEFGLSTAIGTVSGQDRTRLIKDLKSVINRNEAARPEQRAEAIRKFFGKLTAAERSSLAIEQPDVVGRLDGAPATVRYAANRLLIERALAHEQKDLAALKATDPKSPQVTLLEKRVARMTEFLQPRVTGDGRSVPRQFLLFDPAGDGRVAEVFGDLAKAEHVAVMVPGITNRLDNYQDLAIDAQTLITDPDTKKDLPKTAVITWLGYDTPELGDSVLQAKAEAGAPALHSFRAGLEAAKGAKFALFAHSYGTLLSSKALQQGTPFDSVVFMGSPGLGANVKSVADLKLAPGTPVFAMRAPGDWVSYSEAHGKDPAELPGVRRLATGHSSGHSQYYIPNNTALQNLQTILTGDGCYQSFLGSPELDDEQFGASAAPVLVKELQSRVPQWKVGELGAVFESAIKSALDGNADLKTKAAQIWQALQKANLDGYFTKEDIAAITAKTLAASGDLIVKRYMTMSLPAPQ
ncbi:alpha/beta hydrolase [Microbispora hainanensis]|uniref:alpha/beta hydrolase n=1 Tax=Microbispora hainanensis TaxID=568844 RepID=UPI00142EFBA4|nr:alpha/beta hydrolase [Microbispora hainanensis]